MSTYWDEKWRLMHEELKHVPMDSFRSNESNALARNIVKQSFTDGKREALVDFVLDSVPARWCGDSLAGNPEFRYDRDGWWVTPDSCQHAYAVDRLVRAGVVAEGEALEGGVLEVGAGYGAFAHQMHLRAFISRYTFVDKGPSLEVQEYAVGHWAPFPAYFTDTIESMDEGYDLGVAMHCLGEMSKSEAVAYLDMFTRSVRVGGHLFILSWPHESLRGARAAECSRLADYREPLSGSWETIFEEPWPAVFDSNPCVAWLLKRG